MIPARGPQTVQGARAAAHRLAAGSRQAAGWPASFWVSLVVAMWRKLTTEVRFIITLGLGYPRLL